MPVKGTVPVGFTPFPFAPAGIAFFAIDFFILCFVFCIFSIILFSQESKIVLDSVIAYDGEVDNDEGIYWIKTYTYDASGTYRFGNINGPIISELKLTSVVYLYDKNDIVIGRIKLIELNDNIEYITSYKTL